LDETNVTLNYIYVSDSISSLGGVIYINQFSPLSIDDSVFINNQALKYGGVAYVS